MLLQLKMREPELPPRVALTIEESAAAVGLSLSHFRRYVLPEIKTIRTGATVVVPVNELWAWSERAAVRAIDGEGA